MSWFRRRGVQPITSEDEATEILDDLIVKNVDMEAGLRRLQYMLDESRLSALRVAREDDPNAA